MVHVEFQQKAGIFSVQEIRVKDMRKDLGKGPKN
jgi:hypothetical protein